MAEKLFRTQLLELDKTVARVAIVVQEINPRTERPHIAVTLVNRPYWSKQGASEWSLVGGKVNDDDIAAAGISDRQRTLNIGESEAITRRTAQRETREEVNVDIPLEALIYAGLFPNGEWMSSLFFALYQERPSITVGKSSDPMDQLDGFVWMGADRVAVGGTIFTDHKKMIDDAVVSALKASSGKK